MSLAVLAIGVQFDCQSALLQEINTKRNHHRCLRQVFLLIVIAPGGA